MATVAAEELESNAEVSAADLSNPSVAILLLAATPPTPSNNQQKPIRGSKSTDDNAGSLSPTPPADPPHSHPSPHTTAPDPRVSPSDAQAVFLTGMRLKQALHKARFPAPEVVHVAPHTRALQTAAIAGSSSREWVGRAPVRVDMRLRARRGPLPAARLASVGATRKEFPAVVLNDLEATQEVVVEGEEVEEEEVMAERAQRFLDVCLLRSSTFKTSLVVADEDVLRVLLGRLAGTGPSFTGSSSQRIDRPFGKGELRVCVLRRPN